MAVTWKKIAYQDDLDSHASQHGVSGSDTVFPADPGEDKYLMWDDDPGEIVWAAGGESGGDCSIKTGTYTGDGEIAQGITGVGFAPKYVRIWQHPIVATTYITMEKIDESFWGDYNFNIFSDGAQLNRISSLDADGFTVDDQGADGHPNADTYVYDFMCLG